MNFFKSFKSMQTGFGLLLLISLVASFIDLSNSAFSYYHFSFYALVLLFVLNLAIYIVNKIKKIRQLLKTRADSRASLYRGLGQHISLLAVHAGIALLFIGNIVDVSLGYNMRLEMNPGETITLPASDILVKLEDFSIDYYNDGSPSQYTSKILVTGKDNKEEHYTITVNHPFEMSGAKMYQEGYGWNLNVEIGDSSKSEKFLVKPGDEVTLGENHSKIEISRYVPNFVPGKIREQGGSGNPAVIYFIPQKNITGAAKLGEKVKIGESEYLTFLDKQAFTVLKVKTSPGMPLVESGGALLVIGIVLVFWFRNHQAVRFNAADKDVANND
ncbi:cytochrome c biogenesis protein ResB [Sporomusa acidovorans]|uniref:Cytochrome c biogenesis protein Ccs1 n=1 Tax=Sporomusa acidovorans (strain ATCC 49682 / DSM 3132 / Mol) TaxID=1123286 RepID=A0ABZ3J771_SPOA4|nr:cytochrome c biogenesis protein ResB [Sporomusa acidovorans]OZC21007.1 cytochrome c biogenesis protein Ccs1 [Sporomusa acidovorans DSM 3132]SDF18536.1 cytochrome c biogenesis protein [Sporomusa acidovorans]